MTIASAVFFAVSRRCDTRAVHGGNTGMTNKNVCLSLLGLLSFALGSASVQVGPVGQAARNALQTARRHRRAGRLSRAAAEAQSCVVTFLLGQCVMTYERRG